MKKLFLILAILWPFAGFCQEVGNSMTPAQSLRNSLILSAGNAQGPFFLPQSNKVYSALAPGNPDSEPKFVLYAGIRYLRQARNEWFQYGIALHIARGHYSYYSKYKYTSVYLDPTVRFNLVLLQNKLRLFAEPGISIQGQFHKGGNRQANLGLFVSGGANYTLGDRFFLELKSPTVEGVIYTDSRPIRYWLKGSDYQWRPATLGLGYKF